MTEGVIPSGAIASPQGKDLQLVFRGHFTCLLTAWMNPPSTSWL